MSSNWSRRAAELLILALLAPGCHTWARQNQHTLKVDLPEHVPQGGLLNFRVDVVAADGQAVPGLTYGWLVDWPEVRGILHTGISMEPQKMEVK